MIIALKGLLRTGFSAGSEKGRAGEAGGNCQGAGGIKMGAVKIPIDQLSPETLMGVIEEYVTRDGTDYGKTEVSLETKIGQVKYQLEKKYSVLLYDKETDTCNIFQADDPVVRGLGE